MTENNGGGGGIGVGGGGFSSHKRMHFITQTAKNGCKDSHFAQEDHEHAPQGGDTISGRPQYPMPVLQQMQEQEANHHFMDHWVSI